LGVKSHRLRVFHPGEAQGKNACGRVVGGFTDREVKLLQEARALKLEERDLHLRGDTSSQRDEIRRRLLELKTDLEEARRERMSLLGHR
jgi:hypothetical protein